MRAFVIRRRWALVAAVYSFVCELDLDETNDQTGMRRADISSGFPA